MFLVGNLYVLHFNMSLMNLEPNNKWDDSVRILLKDRVWWALKFDEGQVSEKESCEAYHLPSCSLEF